MTDVLEELATMRGQLDELTAVVGLLVDEVVMLRDYIDPDGEQLGYVEPRPVVDVPGPDTYEGDRDG